MTTAEDDFFAQLVARGINLDAVVAMTPEEKASLARALGLQPPSSKSRPGPKPNPDRQAMRAKMHTM
jgi:hypothetical protein